MAVRESSGPLDRGWRWFGLAFGAGVLAIFFYHVGSMVAALRGSTGLQLGALLTMLFMIFMTFFTLAVVGIGLARAIRRQNSAAPGPEEATAPTGSSDEPTAASGGPSR